MVIRDGSIWRNLAAAALLSSSRHQDGPSIGPATTESRSPAGSDGAIACRRALESRPSSARRANVGESMLACRMETAVLIRRCKGPVIVGGMECT